jgi:hypothetical protein
MKAGLFSLALNVPAANKSSARNRLVFLTSDEEIGSDASRKLIEAEAPVATPSLY